MSGAVVVQSDNATEPHARPVARALAAQHRLGVRRPARARDDVGEADAERLVCHLSRVGR